MFEYPKVTGAGVYELQLIGDTIGANFAKPFVRQNDSSTATLVKGLKFGKKYQWRYAGLVKGQTPVWKGPYKFEIRDIDSSGRGKFKVTVLRNDSNRQAGGLIVADIYSIIDRNGEPVWFLPKVKEISDGLLRDLRITQAGTVTFLTGLPYANAYECDLQGNILWKAPDDGKVSGDTSEFYHHEFQRLANGNFIIAGNKFVWKKIPDWFIGKLNEPDVAPGATKLLDTSKQMTEINRSINGRIFTKVQFGTIIEYNRKGEVVWSWNSELYFIDSDIFRLSFQSEGKFYPIIERDAHLNAFAVDAQNEFVYAGFKNINRLVKIERRTGKVVTVWDADFLAQPDGAFYHQHGTSLMANGGLLIFDNSNPSAAKKASKVVALKQPGASSPPAVAFSYPCEFDSAFVKSDKGGNADELPNKNLLVCMGLGLQQRPKSGGEVSVPHDGRIFEITPGKEIVWNATIDGVQPPYRAHYISSLYPCYFTFKAPGLFNRRFSITIYNEGSESDSYLIKLNFKKPGISEQLNVPTIPGNSSREVWITPKSLPSSDGEIEITVQSNANPQLVRKHKGTYRK